MNAFWTDVSLLLAGLLLIVKGGDFFVAGAIRIAEFLRMPRVVIGSTLVSLATTTPELVVSIMSATKGEPGLAVGNAIGSVICNVGLILGITALFKQVDIHPRELRLPFIAMFGAGVVLFIMTWNLSLTRWQGALLFCSGVTYFAWDFWRHWSDRKPTNVSEAVAINEAVKKTRFQWLHTRAGSILQFMIGAGIVVFGSRILVDGAIGLAGRMGISTIIVGLTVVAIGTSLPELVTAITSSRKSVSDLAVGNVLGANIANLTLIVGMAALLQDVKMDRLTQVFNFPAMLLMMVVLLCTVLTGGRITRTEGAFLVASYGCYLIVLVLLTVGR